MQITRIHLDRAVDAGVLNAGQAEALWRFLAAQQAETPTFKAAHILYYVGGLTAIGAMTLFMNLGWDRFGDAGLLTIALLYCALALLLTEWFLGRPALAIPAGVTGALAVAMVPLAVYAAQHVLGYWPAGAVGQTYRNYHMYIDWRWVMMEFATLAAGSIALWRYRLPFMVAPIAVTLWYMSMDLVPFLLGGDGDHDFFSERGKHITLWFGLMMVLTAFVTDLRSRGPKDFAFWLYIFGAMAFWGGLSSLDSNSELGKFLYCCINVTLIAVGAMLSRRVFAVFGGLGVAFYLGHLSQSVFKDSMMFPVALTAIGLGVVAAGVWWQRYERAIGARLRSFLPVGVRELAERRAA